jgi:uncharacterized membrane protein (UPF0127 family)
MAVATSALRTTGYAWNRTRNAYLATELRVANTAWSRLRGLMARAADSFHAGQGLWIVPSYGVHTFGMRFVIDVAYLDRHKTVIHVESGLKPWRVAPIRAHAASVLELPANTLKKTGTAIGDQLEIGFGE